MKPKANCILPKFLPDIFGFLTLGMLLIFSQFQSVQARVLLPGVAHSQLDSDLKGLVLIEELNCEACHKSNASLAARSKKAPRLAEIGSRINPAYVQSFIQHPHEIKPGTTMPDLLFGLGETEKQQVATAITHFLLSLKQNDFDLHPPDSVAAEQGRNLFHSRGCAACHSPRNAEGTELLPQVSVPLGALEKKYSLKSLAAFLRQPHASRPSGRMPDLRLSGQDIERISHYLLKDTQVPGFLGYTMYRGQVWEGLGSDKVEPERAGQVKDFALESLGNVHHHTAIKYETWLNVSNPGRYTCFFTMNGGSLTVDGVEIVKQQPSDRRGVLELQGNVELAAGWHQLQLTYFHTGYEPKFAFEMQGPQFERHSIPSSMLSISRANIPAFETLKVDSELAARGREHFGKLGCASCHDDLGVTSPASVSFSKLQANRGCLSKASGGWPKFDLSDEQRSWIANGVARAEQPRLSDDQQISKTLTAFNCLACHERQGLGGIPTERKALFTGTQPAMGDQGRLPPPLTGVGAKLRQEWISEVLLHGKRQRGYLDASMPQFGEANVGQLVQLFGKVDELETAPAPRVAANLMEFRSAGREMVGAAGMGCILCHEYNGQKSGEVAALDLVNVTSRIKKNWFHLYLRQPSRFHENVIMPGYWPDGKSIRPHILGGDTAQQIEAIWSYLEEGGRAKRPDGLSRQANELRVSDLAEICRGRSPVGYRGVGVGYPERINLTFDSEEMALRELWKGEFANVDLGSFHPRGTDHFSFPPGIPFHRLKSLEDNWPYKGKTSYPFPQDHGYQFRGYHLDALRRPTFLYHYGEIAVEDFFEDVRDQSGQAFFKRTLSFRAPENQSSFYFRAAAGKLIAKETERSFRIDQLRLRIIGDHSAILRPGNPAEVLIPLTLPQGASKITLEYQW